MPEAKPLQETSKNHSARKWLLPSKKECKIEEVDYQELAVEQKNALPEQFRSYTTAERSLGLIGKRPANRKCGAGSRRANEEMAS